MKSIYHRLIEQTEQERACVLATIIRQSGAAPRGLGARCLILEDGSLVGTIGGGLLEAQTLQAAKSVLESGVPQQIHFSLKGSEVARTDMLCGGEVDVYLEPISPADKRLVTLYREVVRCHDQGVLGIVATGTDPNQWQPGAGPKFFLDRNGKVLEKRLEGEISVHLPPEYLTRVLEQRKPLLFTSKSQEIDVEVFLEPILSDPVLFIFGAGHVSRDIAPIASRVGFQVIVIDDREEFANQEHFPDATEVCLHPFDNAVREFPVDEDSYLVIVTRGHLHDKVVLAQCLKTSAKYVGMIGSKRKRNMIYEALLEEGFTREDISRVHSPIGIDIQAETPAEIAVSIVAELIQVRAGKA